MRCLIIPKIHDKAAVPAKYHHEGYTADINLVCAPICDYDSLLSSMSVAFYYDPTELGHKIVTSYGLDLCRCGYSYVSGWLRPDEYMDLAKYHSFSKERLNSVYGVYKCKVSSLYGTAPYIDTDSVIVSGGDDHE